MDILEFIPNSLKSIVKDEYEIYKIRKTNHTEILNEMTVHLFKTK